MAFPASRRAEHPGPSTELWSSSPWRVWRASSQGSVLGRLEPGDEETGVGPAHPTTASDLTVVFSGSKHCFTGPDVLGGDCGQRRDGPGPVCGTVQSSLSCRRF